MPGSAQDTAVALAERLARAERLLFNLTLAYVYAFPADTVGGLAAQRRRDRPKPGDLVAALLAPAPPCQRIGTLREHDPRPSDPLGPRWLIDCLDGQPRWWSNVRVVAVPVGNPFEFSNIDAAFREVETTHG